MQETKPEYPEITSYGDAKLYPLSFQQERVLYLNKLSADGPLWNRISCKRLVGKLDVRTLRDSVAALIERHSALRTRISVAGGTPLQSWHETLDGAFELVDVSGAPAERVDERARAVVKREYETPIVLEGGPLFKTVLVRCSDDEVWLIFKLHHIISDATTLRILWNDLKTLYNARRGGKDALRPLDIEIFDYARWLREHFDDEDTKRQEAWWLRQFEGEIPELDLPVDGPAPPHLTFSGALERYPLSQHFMKRLHAFSFDRRAIPFSTMLSAYYLLLHHYCRQDDIVIGTVFSGRHYSPKLKHLAGFFVNTVALRARLDRAQTVEELVKGVHALVEQAHAMQDYPLQRLVDRLNPGREQKRNPLYRVMFNMLAEQKESRTFDGVQREEWREPEITATQVDLFLELHTTPDVSELRTEYNADIFRRATIQRMLRHYVTLLENMFGAPQAPAFELSMLDAAERRRVLSFGEGEAAPAQGPGIVDLLEQRAARAPDEPALLHRHERFTCGEVNTRANRLAAALVRAGVLPGDIVAIMLDRSPEMVFGLFAILKAGAAYLPIDPSFPRQRVEAILRDSGTRHLLVDAGARVLASEAGMPPLRVIEIDREASSAGDGANLGTRIDPESPAYVIYTSGSTGTPKGVVVAHRALMNTLRFLEARYPLAEGTILLKTNFTFDVSATELFGWLFGSGKLAILEKGAEKDPARLLETLAAARVTHVNFVPSMLDALLAGLREDDVRAFERLAYVFVAGEALQPELVRRFHGMFRDVQLEDLYGPTEAAIYATAYSLPRESELRRVPIGKPVTNTRAYVLDESSRLAPVGITGELCLSGAGLARGYLHQPDLTADRFRANPYWEGERLYRTGDLAKWDDDGQIQFLGRADGQVKIRGFRVELNEVERRLQACRGVAEAAVAVRTDSFGQNGLVGYVVREPRCSGSTEELRADLAAWLPGYMVPEHFVELQRLPRLASGKVDLKALPRPELKASAPAAGPQAPTELENKIIAAAQSVLNTTGLDPSSNFFALGGNSLLTLRFIAALDESLGTRLSVMDFLSLPSIAEIAKLIESSGVGTTP